MYYKFNLFLLELILQNKKILMVKLNFRLKRKTKKIFIK